MKWKERPAMKALAFIMAVAGFATAAIMKALAFIMAVAGFATAAIMGWYQLANFDVLWGASGDYGPGDGYTVRYLEQQDSYNLGLLLDIYNMQEQGVEPSVYFTQEKTYLEERFAADNTNLRWQLLDEEGAVLYGNTEEKIPAQAEGLYWMDYQWDSGVDVQVSHYSGTWADTAAGAVNVDGTESVYQTEDWRNALGEMLRSGVELSDDEMLDTIWTDTDGFTDLLVVESGGERYVFGPTLRSAMESNQFGYIWNDTWVQESLAGAVMLPLVMWLESGLPVADGYRDAYNTLRDWEASKGQMLAVTIACGVAGLLLTIYLMAAAGHKRGHEELYLNWFHRIPGDLLLTGIFFGVMLLAALTVETLLRGNLYGAAPMYAQLIYVGVLVSAAAGLVIGGLVTIAARCKARTIWRNTLVWRLCRWLWRLCRRAWNAGQRAAMALPLVWKVVLLGVTYMLFTMLFFLSYSGLWLLGSLLLLGLVGTWAYQWKRIRQGAQEIIGGNPDYHIDTRRMLPDLRQHADELNNLGASIAAAVDDRMKSEHFKAELITNVSHDLKTPLTSIINYVDLLKKENIDNPKAAEYIEVLDRKSQRLKKLTEDLVEASKASTGNLAVMRERIGLTQLADQALAEYEDRLEGKQLTVVRLFPEEEVWVEADGRHLWRVLDNLLSNCAKYAMEGTRVYLEIRRGQALAELSVKNISRDALNVPPESLMERFVRGDESRTTEGSGLGLSIAQSLTELQKGRFQLNIDGDLFKAVVTLPLAEEEG